MAKTREEHDKVINTPTYNGKNAALAVIDAKRRNAEALSNNAKFFNKPDHIRRIQLVSTMVKSFFPKNAGIYINHRDNAIGKPFTTVKVSKPVWPKVDAAARDAFASRIRALGNVEIVYSAQSKSWLYRIS